jgi:RNA polymerase sigma-70 factor (ECF subfamily)
LLYTFETMLRSNERPPAELERELTLIEHAVRRSDDGAFTPEALDAVSSLYSMHHPTAFGVIRRGVHQHATAEDLTQDVMESVLLRQLPKKPAPRAVFPKGLGGYVQTSARHALVSHYRRSSVHERTTFEWEQEHIDLTLEDGEPSTERRVVEGSMALEELLTFLHENGMSMDRLSVLVMAGVELTYDEIAAREGVPRGTVMSRLNRARKQARDLVRSSGLFDVSADADFGLSTSNQ